MSQPIPDYKVVANSQVQGVTIVHSMNEAAFDYLVDEMLYGPLPNGDVAIPTGEIDYFLTTTESAHFWSEIVWPIV